MKYVLFSKIMDNDKLISNISSVWFIDYVMFVPFKDI